MIPNTVKYTLCLFFIAIMQVYALPEDRDEVVYLSSDQADINQEKHQGTFVGHVQIDQGTSHLRAAKAMTHGDKNNQLENAIAKGNTHSKAHFWTLLAQDKPDLHAWADLIYYYPKKNRIELIGRAEVTQGENTFKAHRIVYDTEKQHILTESNEQSRTTITFYPEKKS